MQQRKDTSITVDGIKYDFQGRFDRKKDVEDIARTWKKRGYKIILKKAPYPYSGWVIYIEA